MTPGPSNVAVRSSAANTVMLYLRVVRWETKGITRLPHTPNNTSTVASRTCRVLGTTNMIGWMRSHVELSGGLVKICRTTGKMPLEFDWFFIIFMFKNSSVNATGSQSSLDERQCYATVEI